MNPPCARCSKTVYPVEKLNVLDKIWHRGCFKCDTCSITLTLKTYKGYNKVPYCNVHYPSTKFTAVADTPENLRLKSQTDNLSLHNYHAHYNTAVKGTKMSVADDPESLRAKKTQNQLSQIKYHGKDRVNPATTPLSRPAFSAPGYVINHQNGDAEGDVPPPTEEDLPVPEPEREPTPEPEPVPEPEPEPEPVPEPEVVPEPPSPINDQPTVGKVDSDTEVEPPIPVETPSPEPAAEPEPEEVAPPAPEPTPKYIAMYDYEAGDEDEVTIKEGDLVINGEVIAEGWMVGTNVRTGLHGMLPSNYVELCP